MTFTNNSVLASVLASAKSGTFTGLIIRKKGAEKGRGAEKKRYGNDLVHVCMISGFSYTNLVTKSRDLLGSMNPLSFVDDSKGLTRELALQAYSEILESLDKSAHGENEATTDHVYNPLVVEGTTITGARVYQCVKNDRTCHCKDCTGDEKAPINGTIYLQGLKIGEKVLEPAPNGPVPAPNSAPLTILKNKMRSLLPVARYVSYALEPDTGYILRAGGAPEYAILDAEVTPYVK